MWVKQKLTAGCCVRKSGRKMGPGAGNGMGVKTVPGGLIMPKGRQTEEIRVEDPLEPDFFFKNQAGKVSGYSGSTYSHLSDVGSWDTG